MAIPQFIVTAADVDALLGDSADVGDALDASALEGMNFTFRSNIHPGTFVPVDGGIYLVQEVQAQVDSSGVLCRVDPLTGALGDPGVALLADDPSLGLDGPLQWQVRPNPVVVLNKTIRPKKFWFDAAADGATVTLSSLTPVPGVEAEGIRGLPVNGVRRSGNDLIFSTAAADIPDPVDISDFVIPPEARNVIYVDSFSGVDPTGATSSDTGIAAARTALGSSPGVLVFGCGTYAYSTPIATLSQYQGIVGQGVGDTVLKFSGTGAAISAFDTRDPIYTFPAQLPGGAGGPGFAGPLKGFTLLGNSPGANSTGIHIGDLTCVDMDVVVASFTATGNKGIWFDNQKTWLERASVRAHVSNCKQAFVFDAHGGTVSYEYNDFHLSAHCVADQDGLVLVNDANIIGKLRFYGNFEPGVTNTGVAVKVGSGSTDLAYIFGDVDLHCESVGSGVHHTDIQVNGNQGYIRGRATVKMNGPFVAGNAFGRVNLLGSVDTPSLGAMDLPQSARAMGMMGLTWGYLGPTGDWYPGMGNVFYRQMTAGAQTFTINYFRQPTNTAAVFDLFIQQPASGSTTLTWPGNFVWMDGIAPTLSGAVNAIDHIRVVTPDFGTFYCKHVNASVAPGIHAATSKTTPVDADEFALVDSAASNGPKKLTFANLKATIKAYYDTVTSTMTNKTLTDPKINAIKDTNGNAALDLSATASAVNRLRVNNAAAGGWPGIESLGPDGGMSMSWAPTGFYSWMGANAALDWAVDGSGSDVGFNVQTKGGGRVKENGNIAGTFVSVPATATSTGKQYQMAADSSWLYVCTATNTWRRVAIASW